MIDPLPNESPDEGDDHDDEHSTTSNAPGSDDIHLPGGHAGASLALPTPSKQLHTKPFAEFRRPPHGGVPVDVTCVPENAKISVFPVQPPIITLFPVQGGKTMYLSELHLLSYPLSSES